MDWEAQDDAFVAKLLVPEGAKDIAVGAPVAVFVEDKARACGRPLFVFLLHAGSSCASCAG